MPEKNTGVLLLVVGLGILLFASGRASAGKGTKTGAVFVVATSVLRAGSG